MPSSLEHALRYLGMGLSVIPLRPRPEPDPDGVAKRSLGAWKAYQERQPTEEELRAWWDKTPSAGVAIICGTVSGVVGVDLDSDRAVTWAQEHLPATQLRVKSIKGEHWYYRHPGGTVNNKVKISLGNEVLDIDVRGDGGYLCAPPTIHPSGAPYEQLGAWDTPVTSLPVYDPCWLEIPATSESVANTRYYVNQEGNDSERQNNHAEAEDNLIGRFLPPAPVAKRISVPETFDGNAVRAPKLDQGRGRPDRIERALAYLDKCQPAVEGAGGDMHTYKTACWVVGNFGLSVDEAFALMSGEWNSRCQPPWSPAELRKKIASADKSAKGPRGVALVEGTRTTSTGVPLQLVGADGTPIEAGDDPRPVIRVDMADMDRMVRESEAALMLNCPDLYQSLMRIVIVHTVGEARKPSSQFKIPDEPIIDQVSEHWLAVLLERSARWTKRQQDRTTGLWHDVPAPVPDKVAKTLLVKPSKGFRYLKGIIEAPTLRPDGTLLSAPGFDERTGLLYLPSGEFPDIPDTPSDSERQAAIDLLLEIVQDFPFAAECHRSAAVAAIITPLLRPTYEGNTPLMVGDAPTPGSGKGHWARLASRLACGRRSAGNTLSDDDKENKLNLFSYALSGRRMVVFEEVQELKSKALNMVVTDGIEGRIYHSQKMAKADAEFTIYCNGNNLVIHDDTRRRMNYIRLEPAEENPEERANFLHPELEDWVVENRGRIVAAVLTLARAYHLAGCPMRLPAFNSFNGWSRVVRGMLVWAGMADPRAGSADVNTNADERIASFRGFLELVQARYGRTGMTLTRIISENDGNDLGALLLELAPSRAGTEVDQNKLKYIVRKFARRTMGGRRIVADALAHGGARKWLVESVSSSGPTGSATLPLQDPSPAPCPEMVAPGPEAAPPPPAATIDDRSVLEAELEAELEGALVQWLGQAGAVSAELWRALASKPGAQAWAKSPLPGVAPYVPMARRFAQLDDVLQRVLVARAAAYVEAQMIDSRYDIGRPTWRWAVHRTETLDAWLTWLREHGGALAT